MSSLPSELFPKDFISADFVPASQQNSQGGRPSLTIKLPVKRTYADTVAPAINFNSGGVQNVEEVEEPDEEMARAQFLEELIEACHNYTTITAKGSSSNALIIEFNQKSQCFVIKEPEGSTYIIAKDSQSEVMEELDCYLAAYLYKTSCEEELLHILNQWHETTAAKESARTQVEKLRQNIQSYLPEEKASEYEMIRSILDHPDAHRLEKLEEQYAKLAVKERELLVLYPGREQELKQLSANLIEQREILLLSLKPFAGKKQRL